MDTIFDLIIIGGGPAGTSGAVYAARKRLKTALVTYEFGGQSTVSSDIQNWIGTPHISGEALKESFKKHVLEYKSDVLTVFEGSKVTNISGTNGDFTVKTDDAKTIKGKTVLITSGSERRKLDVPGADVFEHKGLTYCATCDGPLFSDQDVVVVGGGNAAFETVLQLAAYCKSVTLLNRSETFRADEITVGSVTQNPKVRIVKNIEMLEVTGTVFVNGIKIKHKESGEEETIPCAGIFVEIGQIPNTSYVGDLVEKDAAGKILIDPWTNKTKTPGVWAAGDVTNILYHQNNIASGEAVKALEDIYITFHKEQKNS